MCLSYYQKTPNLFLLISNFITAFKGTFQETISSDGVISLTNFFSCGLKCQGDLEECQVVGTFHKVSPLLCWMFFKNYASAIRFLPLQHLLARDYLYWTSNCKCSSVVSKMTQANSSTYMHTRKKPQGDRHSKANRSTVQQIQFHFLLVTCNINAATAILSPSHSITTLSVRYIWLPTRHVAP